MRKVRLAGLLFFALFLVFGQGINVLAAESKSPCASPDGQNKNQFLEVCLGIPLDTVITFDNGQSKKFGLNFDLLENKGFVVYGTPQDVQKYGINDYKEGQWRYLGYVEGGGLYTNVEFPPDSLKNKYITKRNLIKEPWENKEKYHTRSYTPQQPDWWRDYSRKQLADQLSRIVDPYFGTADNPAGDFANLNGGENWADYLVDYMTFQQPVTKYGPGIVTEMHKSYVDGSLWYETFQLEPEHTALGDLWVDLNYIELTNPVPGAKTTVKIKVHNSFDTVAIATKISYRWGSEPDASTLDVYDIPAHGSKIVELPNVILPSVIPKAALKANEVKTSSVEAEKDKFIVNLNPNRNSPPIELTFSNNRAAWDVISLLEKPIETPPISFKDISPYESTAYWQDIQSPNLDRYELKCSPSYKTNYAGTLTAFTLTGLTPNTDYTCKLEAFDKDGVSGGVTTGTFKTKPIPSDTGSGYWKDRGIIREVNNQRQGYNQIPTRGLDYSDYAADEVKSVANKYSPYFGEKLGVYGQPATLSTTHTWTFTYTDSVYDSCKSKDKNGKCVGGYTSVTRTGSDYCTIEYPAVAPSGWSSITSNPSGLKLLVDNDWNDEKAYATVTGVQTKSCVGSNQRDPDKNQFTYFVPREYVLPPRLFIDQGFDSTTNSILPDYENLQLKIHTNTVALGADHRSIIGKESVTPIKFLMKWSKFTALGAGN